MSEYLSRVAFAWPWAWLLLVLPLISRFIMAKEQRLNEFVRVPFLPALINELQLNSQPARSGKLTSVVFWLSWALLVCALARPEFLTPPQHIEKPMRNIMLILDVSGSMEKNDVAGGVTRLQAVQASVKKFVAARKSDRIGLVIFANGAWPFAPVSEDKQALETRINQLTPGMAGQQTAIGDALGVTVKLLDSTGDTDASKLAIILTDGNDTASQLTPKLAAQLAASHHVQVHTIAFGDLNSQGDDKVDLPLLQEIARVTGGRSWTAANSGASLDAVWHEIDAITPVQVKSIGWSWRVPLFMWPLCAGLLLVLAFNLYRALREVRT
ncbi:VWA domain-containing protein [Salmonella enterica subsp. enterica serovar Oslo]|nr:VWA domain-containing protein [Salmonella enterica]EBB9036823.1 VWA domain-containing protein [Salmonella enterica subsp. enterica serovar Oslo]ECD0768208.1 VWA domain-containing protein [Salmonella enterica subsp. enterica serovar Papuana]EAN4769827.1 VWA domain-containing protein [Salmonella enterica]EAS5669509.1 VWA domain-containing protein [Salmonella enterica]